MTGQGNAQITGLGIQTTYPANIWRQHVKRSAAKKYTWRVAILPESWVVQRVTKAYGTCEYYWEDWGWGNLYLVTLFLYFLWTNNVSKLPFPRIPRIQFPSEEFSSNKEIVLYKSDPCYSAQAKSALLRRWLVASRLQIHTNFNPLKIFTSSR